MTVYPFALGRAVRDGTGSSAEPPVLLATSPSGYVVIDLPKARIAELRWPEHHRGPRIGPDSMDDGCWVLSAERCPAQGPAEYRVYWAYPFSPRVHYWELDRDGSRLRGHDLAGEELLQFLTIRKREHVQYLVRLVQIAARDAAPALASLIAELPDTAIYDSLEVAHLCCSRPDLFPPGHDVVARQLLRGFLAMALEGGAKGGASASRVAPIIEALGQGEPGASEQFDAEMKKLAERLVNSASCSPGDRSMYAAGSRSRRASDLMSTLFGADIYGGFRPNRPLDLQGWNSEHPILASLVERLRPGIVLDVGVWKGGSTVFLANLVRRYGTDGVVIAIDTFLGSPEHWSPGSEMFDSLLLQHGYPSLYWQFLSNIVQTNCQYNVIPLPQTSENAAAILHKFGIRADLVHIDAAHDYGSVLRDARSYWELLSPGGALVGDDYHESWPDVVRAADDFAAEKGLRLEVHSPKWVVHKPPA